MTRLRTAYFIIANTAILLLLVDVGADVAIKSYQRIAPALSHAKLSAPAKSSYAHMTPAEVDELLRTTGELRFRYVPQLGFVQEATTSRFVNIDSDGVRSNGKGHRGIAAMQNAIWFFGGSTALGYGVADHETIPARLEEMLGRPVINLGVRGNASKMENRLLTHYLRIGYRPATAFFFDGINESCEADLFEQEMAVVVERSQYDYHWEFGRPVAYAYGRISRGLKRLVGLDREPADRVELNCFARGRHNPLQAIHERTLAERDVLCRLYKITCHTIVQPFAGVHGRHDDQAFMQSQDADYMRRLFKELEPIWRAAGATFVTDALDRSDRHAFVDSAHYNAEANRLIAEAIAARIR